MLMVEHSLVIFIIGYNYSRTYYVSPSMMLVRIPELGYHYFPSRKLQV